MVDKNETFVSQVWYGRLIKSEEAWEKYIKYAKLVVIGGWKVSMGVRERAGVFV